MGLDNKLYLPVSFFSYSKYEYYLDCNDGSLEKINNDGASIGQSYKTLVLEISSIAGLKTLLFEVCDNSVVKFSPGENKIISFEDCRDLTYTRENFAKLEAYEEEIELNIKNSQASRDVRILCEVYGETDYVKPNEIEKVYLHSESKYTDPSKMKYFLYFEYNQENNTFSCWWDYGYLHFLKNKNNPLVFGK